MHPPTNNPTILQIWLQLKIQQDIFHQKFHPNQHTRVIWWFTKNKENVRYFFNIFKGCAQSYKALFLLYCMCFFIQSDGFLCPSVKFASIGVLSSPVYSCLILPSLVGSYKIFFSLVQSFSVLSISVQFCLILSNPVIFCQILFLDQTCSVLFNPVQSYPIQSYQTNHISYNSFIIRPIYNLTWTAFTVFFLFECNSSTFKKISRQDGQDFFCALRVLNTLVKGSILFFLFFREPSYSK